MRYLRSFSLFLWDFVIGDDWRIAAGVVAALALTAAVGAAGGWWIVPLFVAALLTLSVWRAARAGGA